MSRSKLFFVAVFAVATCVTVASPALAQESADEVALARSAAPTSFSGSATVLVLRDGELEVAAAGRPDRVCFVSRGHADSAFPMCYDEAAVRSVLPITRLRLRLQHQGLDDATVQRRVEAQQAAGALPTPERGALAWMLSSKQNIYAGERPVGQWHPHLMIYMPHATVESLGLPTPSRGDVFVRQAGTANAYLLVVTPHWSDDPAYQ